MKLLFLLLFCLVPTPMEALSLARSSSPNCPHPRLAHGRVQYRQQGRAVRFVCDRFFRLVGKQYAKCEEQGWDNPTPVCVRSSPRCPVPSIENGVVFPYLNNAWLEFFCLPGMVLVGSSVLYCDGASWNGTAPTCVPESSGSPVEVQLSCNFEIDLCGWQQDNTHDFDWTRHSMKTPSSHAFTGPSHDHTFGNSSSGYYMYIESSSRNNNDLARLISPVYNSNLTQDGCFSLFYHMYGESIGGLRVYQILENSPQILHLGEAEKQGLLLFEKWGNLGDKWFRNVSTLRNSNSSFQIVIEGVRGSSFTSDIAIDDLDILQGEQCRYASDTAVTPSNPLLETCSGRCELSGPPTLRSGCGCNVECLNNQSCCPDFLDLCIFGGPPPDVPLTTTTNTLATTSTMATPTTTNTPSTAPTLTTTLSTTTTTTTTTLSTTDWTEVPATTETTDYWSSTDHTVGIYDRNSGGQEVTSEVYETTFTEGESSTAPLSTTTVPPRPPPVVLQNVTVATVATVASTASTIPPRTMPTTTTIKPITTTKLPTINLNATTPAQPNPELGGDHDKHQNIMDEKAESSDFTLLLVTLLVLAIFLVVVALVTILTLRRRRLRQSSKPRMALPFQFRAKFVPNAGETGGHSEIPIFEFRGPGEEACSQSGGQAH